MKLKENILAGLGKQIDLSNTINGGITMTTMELSQTKEGYWAKFHNPAFTGDNYHVEVNQNLLTVYATLSNDFVRYTDEGNKLLIPTFIRSFPIPQNVDVEGIEATFDEKVLTVFAPFKSDFNNRSKKIDIQNI